MSPSPSTGGKTHRRRRHSHAASHALPASHTVSCCCCLSSSLCVSADNGATFAAFPALDAFILRLAPLIRGLFTGNPALKHADPSKPVKLNEDGQPEEEEEQPEEETEAAEGDDSAPRRPPERKLTEEERLAFTVRAIDDECCIAPVGQSFLSPTGVVTADPAFSGLPLPQLPSLSQWGHYRDPVTAEAKARIRKAAPSNCYDWMDAVLPELEGAPASDWVVQVAEGGLTVRLRSLQWLGWEVTAQAGGRWQAGYFGYGERNEELHFML